MDNIDGINAGVFILRVAVGIVMIAHGYNHIWGGGKIEGTAGWFESLGMKPGILHAWLASLTELGAGAMLIFGFLTPLAAGGVVGVMLVALITNHLKNGFFIFRPGEGWEYVMTLAALGLVVAVLGPGEWSIDDRSETLRDLWGWTGFWIAAIAGAGGATVLMATFWRPARDAG